MKDIKIKDTPTNFRVYYKSMKDAYTQKIEEDGELLNKFAKNVKELYDVILKDFNLNKNDFEINLNEYEEFINNRYSTGQFLRIAKGIFANRKGNYELLGRNYDIYKLAKLQKDIYDTKNNLSFYRKMVNLTLKEYKEILKLYYTKVQEKLILDGCGYAFQGDMGWICINRVHIKKTRPHIDYSATKARKKQLQEEGKRIYNKEEAKWCEQNGIEYQAEDGRVFQKVDYIYEIPLLDCHLPDGKMIKFESSDYRGLSVRGKSNDDLLKESNYDKSKICNYDVDIRTKLYICLNADKTLYSKFIRNYDQKASTFK